LAFVQSIEGVRTFAGQQVTLSFWAKVDATKNIAVEFAQSFGSGGSPSSIVFGIGVTKVSIGTSWQKVTVTATMPSISGKTLGTDNNDVLSVIIWFDAGSDFNSRTNSLGQQSGTFEIAQVQLEPGTVATPFERRSYGQELALCQRYYARLNANSVYGAFGSGRVALTTRADIYVKYPVAMRVAPTVSQSNTMINDQATTSLGVTYAGSDSMLQLVNVATGLVASAGCIWAANNNSAAYIDLTAEL
jgi:hypothetical protein